MFHKALWMRQWKQGKYAVLLFWLTSLYILPYKYYLDAASQFQQSIQTYDDYDYVYYYAYYFNASDPVFIQSFLVVLMACLFIGWERNNQSIDFLWSMPFRRKDIYVTKWLFGVINIIAVNIVCLVSMHGIKLLSFHNQYQEDFSPFYTYFLYATIVLIAIYTLALCVGTITGNIFSQISLSAIFLFLPQGLVLLISGFVYAHTSGDSFEDSYKKERKIASYFTHIDLYASIDNFYIRYDYHPEVQSDDEGNIISETPQKNPMENTMIPSIWELLTPITYIIILLPVGAILYTRSPNEQNGKLLLFPKLQKYFMFCTVLCFALLGGRILSESLVSYYIGFFIAGIVSYFIFTRLLKMKFSFGGK
ncbi:acetoin ABC transporter permease [Bacillus manliponensis]|uniref:Acetoin ABC transporter permease n=1 Tax=Bacillus manliponensis TaxID=574376 RepID=A0A073KFJ6_9BACI|nr:ABC transporter permease subunit [Bacillus manliponensis]KEK21068.1 acetoin ABC transporter permease [Bacillus manliponensis]